MASDSGFSVHCQICQTKTSSTNATKCIVTDSQCVQYVCNTCFEKNGFERTCYGCKYPINDGFFSVLNVTIQKEDVDVCLSCAKHAIFGFSGLQKMVEIVANFIVNPKKMEAKYGRYFTIHGDAIKEDIASFLEIKRTVEDSALMLNVLKKIESHLDLKTNIEKFRFVTNLHPTKLQMISNLETSFVLHQITPILQNENVKLK
jgi:hypothetical protein